MTWDKGAKIDDQLSVEVERYLFQDSKFKLTRPRGSPSKLIERSFQFHRQPIAMKFIKVVSE